MTVREKSGKVFRLRARWRRGLACAALLAVLPSCETTHFYSQAVHGQWEILRSQRPTRDVLRDPETPARLRRQLEKVEQIRAFAGSDLGLPSDRQYVSYRDLGREYVAWAIYATPEFSLESKRWWYPFVGRLKYRGWFSVRDATARAERLTKQGFDVAVAGVPAYSTLGWLRDPVLNTFVFLPDTDLAELLFHELTHQKWFISGDTDFNEAFATATAREGVRRWLRAQSRHADLRKFESRLAHEREFLTLVRRTRGELKALYESGRSIPPDILRRQKAATFERLQQRGRALGNRRARGDVYDAWLAQPLNNAWLNTISTYSDLVPAFDRLLEENGGDLDRYFDAVGRLGALERNARKAELERLGGRVIEDNDEDE